MNQVHCNWNNLQSVCVSWRRKWQPTPVFLSRVSCGQRNLWAAVHRVAQNRTRLKRLGMNACIGEGNGNPLQYSCLENPRYGGVCVGGGVCVCGWRGVCVCVLVF